MTSGQRSGPIRRRKRRGKRSERASLIPKSTLSEIFSADTDESDEELELIEVEDAEPEPPPAKRAPWWSVHPVPPPPRRGSTSPPPLRRAAPESTQGAPPLEALETPLSLLPPPVFDSPSSDAPLVAASEPARPRETTRFAMRAAGAVFVLGASVVFGLGLGRAPSAKSVAEQPAGAPKAAAPVAPTAAQKAEPALPAPPPELEASQNAEAAPDPASVISLDDVPASTASVPSTEPALSPSAAPNDAKLADPRAASPKKPSTTLPAFDSAVAASAIDEAARRAAACRSPTDPAGVAMVVLKYAPSGRVTTAVIEGGPFAGTTVGGCIAMAFRGAQVPAFSGEPVTVRKSVTYP